MYILVAWNLKRKYLQAIKGMITDYPLFLFVIFFPLAFRDSGTARC